MTVTASAGQEVLDKRTGQAHHGGMPTPEPRPEPRPGDSITDHRGETWTLVQRLGRKVTFGRDAARGWYQETAFVTVFPGYVWDPCPSCGGPATRYTAGAAPHHDCHPA